MIPSQFDGQEKTDLSVQMISPFELTEADDVMENCCQLAENLIEMGDSTNADNYTIHAIISEKTRDKAPVLTIQPKVKVADIEAIGNLQTRKRLVGKALKFALTDPDTTIADKEGFRVGFTRLLFNGFTMIRSENKQNPAMASYVVYPSLTLAGEILLAPDNRSLYDGFYEDWIKDSTVQHSSAHENDIARIGAITWLHDGTHLSALHSNKRKEPETDEKDIHPSLKYGAVGPTGTGLISEDERFAILAAHEPEHPPKLVRQNAVSGDTLLAKLNVVPMSE